MVNSFVGKFFKRRKEKKRAIKASIIVATILIVLFISFRIANVFILNTIFKNVISDFVKNPDHKVEYSAKFSFLKSKLYVNNIKIKVNTGSVDIENITLSKEEGFIIPSQIKVEVANVSTTSNRGNTYSLLVKGNKPEFFVFLQKHFFKKPTFGGVEIKAPLHIVFLHKLNDIGNIHFERMIFRQVGNQGYTDYSGSMLFHDGDFLPYVEMIDRPFKWDIKVLENTQEERYGIKKELVESIKQVKVEKGFIDLDFASFDAKGEIVFGNLLKTIDLNVNIKNYRELVNNMFNSIIKTRENNIEFFKKFHSLINNDIIPQLQGKNKNKKGENGKTNKEINNKKQTDKELFLKFLKTEDMSEMTINNINVEEITAKIAKL